MNDVRFSDNLMNIMVCCHFFVFYRSENCKSLDDRERPGPVESSKILTDFLDFSDFMDFTDFFLRKKNS